ncbi:MAG: porin family protein [Candidatus Aminicenantaceae bacterium]
MKRLINFILVMMMIAPLYAEFKIIGGINHSKYNSSPNEENITWSNKFGFLGGIGLERGFTPNLIFEFDFLFFQKGGNARFSDSKMKYSLNVVSIPILVKNKFIYGTSPYILGGVEFSSILSHKSKVEGEEAEDLKDNTKSIDFGFVLGCGFEIELKEFFYFFIEARYHLGQRNIVSSIVEDQPIRTRAMLVVIGIKS